MDIYEAIKHCETKAKKLKVCKCADDHKQLAFWLRELKCAEDHKQLALWLRELVALRRKERKRFREELKARGKL